MVRYKPRFEILLISGIISNRYGIMFLITNKVLQPLVMKQESYVRFIMVCKLNCWIIRRKQKLISVFSESLASVSPLRIALNEFNMGTDKDFDLVIVNIHSHKNKEAKCEKNQHTNGVESKATGHLTLWWLLQLLAFFY